MRHCENPQQKQLYSKVIVLDDCACWMWQGQVSNSGYGRLMQAQSNKTVKMVSAHSASYLAFVSPIPEGYLVKQLCGNRLCINPEHLELVKV